VGGRLYYNSPSYGFQYDAHEGRMWYSGTDSNGNFVVAYSSIYDLKTFTWDVDATISTAKSSSRPRSGVVDVIYFDVGTNKIEYKTYTRSTATFSSATDLAAAAFSGSTTTTTNAILIGDVLDGTTNLQCTSSVSDYAPWGAIIIDSERFFYTSLDTVNNRFNDVRRNAFGTTSAAHTSGTVISQDRHDLTYTAIGDDRTKGCLHITYVLNTAKTIGGVVRFGYIGTGYMRHYDGDAAGVWKDESGSTLTLPVTQKTERLVGTPGKANYNDHLTVMSDGDVILPFRYGAALTPYSDPSLEFDSSMVARLPNASSTWSYQTAIDYMLEMASVEIGAAGKLKIVSLSSNLLTTQSITSVDYGATFPNATETINTYSFNKGTLFYSGVALKGGFSGAALMYAPHSATYGDIFLELVNFQPVIKGLARITAVTNKTQAAKGDIKKTATVTQDGKSRITIVQTVTQAGVGRIYQVVSKTLSAVSRVTANGVKAQAGKADIKKTATITQAGVGRVLQTVAKTLAGKASMTSATTRVQTGVAHISVVTSHVVGGVSRITSSAVKAVTGLSRISTLNTSFSVTGLSRITKTVTQTQLGRALVGTVTSVVRGFYNAFKYNGATYNGVSPSVTPVLSAQSEKPVGSSVIVEKAADNKAVPDKPTYL